jgi:3',5'-cyclic-AMP phosphodiesterase
VVETTTVAYDEVVAHCPAGPGAPARVVRLEGLVPRQELEVEGEVIRTLDRPPGELLCTVATVNDLHFGETVCGVIDGMGGFPALSVEPGETPYPELMNDAAVAEISEIGPDAVVAKGDLSDAGRPDELASYQSRYQPAFGVRLHTMVGNHDVTFGPTSVAAGPREVVLPGVRLALLDTTIPREATGAIDVGQLEWLDELASRAREPVLVMGHHHIWDPGSRTRSDAYFGVRPDDSERLVEVVARRHGIVAYLSGHTHRNRVRRFEATKGVPFVEVASVKDYPGVWAEYRVHEGGIVQLVRRCSSPAALAWTERTRSLFGGTYPQYAFGVVEDRCFHIPLRRR